MVESTGSVPSLSLLQLEKGGWVAHSERILAKPASLPPMEKVTRPVVAFRWSSWAGSFQGVRAS